MFTFDTIMFFCMRFWIVAIITMIASKIISAAITGIRQGIIVTKISDNVHRKLDEIDKDMQKYYDYEVEIDDLSNMHDKNKRK